MNEKKIFTLKILWVAFVLQPFLLGFVLYKRVNPVEYNNGSIDKLYIIVSFILAFVSFYLYQRKASPLMREFARVEADESKYQKILELNVFCFVMNDAISLLGFASTLKIHNSVGNYLPFALVTLLLHFGMFPRFRSHH